MKSSEHDVFGRRAPSTGGYGKVNGNRGKMLQRHEDAVKAGKKTKSGKTPSCAAKGNWNTTAVRRRSERRTK